MKAKGLTGHQILNLERIVRAHRAGRAIQPAELNMSVLSGLMRRELVRCVPTEEAEAIFAIFAEAKGPKHA